MFLAFLASLREPTPRTVEERMAKARVKDKAEVEGEDKVEVEVEDRDKAKVQAEVEGEPEPQPPSAPAPSLSERLREMLRVGSGIAEEVIAARGCRPDTAANELRALVSAVYLPAA